MPTPDQASNLMVSPHGALHVVRAALIRDDRLLLAQRETGEWHIPGGKVEPGQALAEAVARECEEEVGVTGIRLDSDFTVFDRRMMSGAPPYGGREYVGHCALGTWSHGEPRPLDETMGVTLIHPGELQSLKQVRPDTLVILAKLGLL